MNRDGLLELVKYPILAIFSKQFYFTVLFKLKGIGFKYLLSLCLILAIAASYKVTTVLDVFKELNVSNLVLNIPPSYIDSNGRLSPNDADNDFVLIKSDKGSNVILYNPSDKNYDSSYNAPFELRSDNIVIRYKNEVNSIPYTAIVDTNTNFEPLASAKILDSLLSMSIIAIVPIVTIWLLYLLLINMVLSALISRVILLYVIKLKLEYKACFRLAAFANTSVAFLLFLQFFIYFPFPYTLMLLIPVIYLVGIGKTLRKNVLANQTAKQQGSNTENATNDDNNNPSNNGGSFSA